MANYRFNILLAMSLTLVSGLPPSQLLSNIALAENQPSQSLNLESPKTMVKMGSKGESVKKLQTDLQKLGFFKGAIDGFYDKQTYEAVIAFQASKGLLVDGIVAAQTWGALAEDIENQLQVNNLETKLEKEAHLQQIPKSNNASPNLLLIVIFGIAVLGMGGGFWLLFQVLKINSTQDQNFEANNLNESQLENQEITPIEASKSQHSPINQLPELPVTGPMEELDTPEEIAGSNVTNPESTSTKETQNPKQKSVSHLKVISPGQLSQNSSSSITETTNNLSSLAKVDLVQELIKDLNQSEPSKRRRAVWELAQRADSRAIEPLVSLMSKADSQETSLILEALTQIATRTLKPLNRAMNMALENDNAEVRKNAIRDLTRIYEVISGVSHQLSLATEDIDPEVQKTAQWALGQLHRIKTSANLASLPGEDKSAYDNNGNPKVRFL